MLILFGKLKIFKIFLFTKIQVHNYTLHAMEVTYIFTSLFLIRHFSLKFNHLFYEVYNILSLTHTHTLFLSLTYSFPVSLCLSAVCLSASWLVCLLICYSICLCLPVCLSLSFFVCLSVCLSQVLYVYQIPYLQKVTYILTGIIKYHVYVIEKAWDFL